MQARETSRPVGRPLWAVAASTRRPMFAAVVVGAVFLASCLCLAVAPLLMPGSYSPVTMAISDTAAQGVPHAWVARLGFLLSAAAIVLLARSRARTWGPWGRALHTLYAGFVVALAVFSQKPWAGGPFNEIENLTHSILAPVAGVAFTAGVLVVSMRRAPRDRLARLLDAVTIGAMLVLPVIMLGVSGLDGASQRTAVAIGYLWYGFETLRLARTGIPELA